MYTYIYICIYIYIYYKYTPKARWDISSTRIAYSIKLKIVYRESNRESTIVSKFPYMKHGQTASLTILSSHDYI